MQILFITNSIGILAPKSFRYKQNAGMKPQHTGICARKVIVAYLKKKLGPEDWLNLNLFLKFLSLGNNLRDKPNLNSYSESIIIGKAAQGLANLASKYFEFIRPSINEKQEKFLFDVCSLSEYARAIAQSANLDPLASEPSQKTSSKSRNVPFFLFPCPILIPFLII